MSVAKNLVAGRILEDQLFPYPQLRDKDRILRTTRWKRPSVRCLLAKHCSASAYEALQIAAGSGFMRDHPGANHAGLPHSLDIRGNQ
jgi:hypothetical protein